MSRWLRLWLSFREPVDRRAYLQSGAALMLLKYTVDASVVWAFAGRWWTPLGYLDPVWTLRQQVLRDALGLLTQNTRPGGVVTIEYPAYGEQYEPPRVKKLS